MTHSRRRDRIGTALDRSVGWAEVLERVESGESIAVIARSFNVTRGHFARLLHEDRERHELVLRARKVAADALVDEALEIVDGVGATREAIQIAKLRSEFRLWLAAKLDREQYGDGRGAPKQPSIGELHLAALRARPVTQVPSLAHETAADNNRLQRRPARQDRRGAAGDGDGVIKGNTTAGKKKGRRNQ
jgi:hypothetical protein